MNTMNKLVNKFVVIIFFTALLTSFLLNLKFFGNPPLPGGDDYYYSYAAQNLLEKGSLFNDKNEPTAMADSAYPLFLAGLYKIFGMENYDAIRIAQIILFALTAVLVYSIAKTIFKDERLGFGAGFLFAFFFPLAGFTIRVIREPLMAFLIVLSIWLLVKAQQTLKFKWFALSGLSVGLMALTNSIAQPFVLFVILGFILIFGRDFLAKRQLLRVGLFLACFLTITIGFLYHFHWEKGTDPLISKFAVLGRKAEMIQEMRGETYFRNLGGLLFGYYFFEKEGFNVQTFLNHRGTSKKISLLAAEGHSPQEYSKILFQDSLDIISNNIPRYFAVTLLDFLQFNGLMLPNPTSFDPAPGQNLFIGGSHPEISAPLKVIILLSLRIIYWLFFGLVIYGVVKALKDWRRFIWLILIVVYYNLIYSAIFGIPRYSVSIYPFYFIFFIYGLWLAYEKLNSKSINKQLRTS